MDHFNSFHTDASATGSGFRLEWYVEGCGGKLYHPEGTLSSPNYPKRYPHAVTCLWEITAEYGQKIEVFINDLDIEHSSSCEFDFLSFSTDLSYNTTIMKLCQSQQTPTVLTSDSHKLYVTFSSDDSNSGKGFNLTYRFRLSDCGGTFVAPSGVISTPKYPTQNYDNKLTCEWAIVTDASHSLTFQFTDFDLEESENCTKDYVEISDPVFHKVLWKGCGNQLPNQTVFKSQRNELVVRLVTDQEITAKGFRGNFTKNCGARLNTNSSGEFQYQRSVMSNDDSICIWTIISDDPARKVTLTFKYLSLYFEILEGLSNIQVFEGDSDRGPLKTAFSGSKPPPAITSNGNALTVKLNSSTNYLSEFHIHYSVLDNGKSIASLVDGSKNIFFLSLWRHLHLNHSR